MNFSKYLNTPRKYINIIIDRVKKKYPCKLAIVAIVKNEAPYILEWLEYHKLVGVNKFYIYDNESTDNIKELLEPYIKSKELVYKYIPGSCQQIKAYSDAIDRYRFDTKYMAFIDVDEFILPVNMEESLIDILDNIFAKDAHTGGVSIQWCVYGSSGYKVKPEGLVIENYLFHAGKEALKKNNINSHVKTIANPRLIKKADCHKPLFWQGYYSVNTDGDIVNSFCMDGCHWDKLRINHYFSKSYEEFIKKCERGRATQPLSIKRSYSEFYAHDFNDVKDTTILRYLPVLKEKLQK